MAGHSDLEAMFMDEDDGTAAEDIPGEDLTAGMVLDELQEAWINEKLCPELLPHKAELIEVMMEQVEQMEENVRQLTRTDIRSMVHRQELERIKYLMKSYMRTRVLKIETFCLYLLRVIQQRQSSSGGPPEEDVDRLLSRQELKYLKEYAANTAGNLKAQLDTMPYPMNQFNAREMEVEPDLECHVFAKSKIDLAESLIIPSDGPNSEEEVNLRRGSQHILPYTVVRPLVVASKVDLI